MDMIIYPVTKWAERNSALVLVIMACVGMAGLALYGAT